MHGDVAARFRVRVIATRPDLPGEDQMAGKIDFFVFYEELGLPPHFNTDDLKQAYRRRVSELHPDHRAGGEVDAGDAERLRQLTSAYNAATTFQRRHGRLPGTHHSAGPASAAVTRSRIPLTAELAPRRISLRRLVFAVLVLFALAWLLLSNTTASNTDRADDSAPARTFTPAAPLALRDGMPVQQLSIGMDSDAVRALQGNPLMENGEHWNYGPSWIQFNQGQVSDWYSSRLRPLKVAAARPPAEAAQTR